MSFWNRIIDTFNGAENKPARYRAVSHDASRYGFVDVEIGLKDSHEDVNLGFIGLHYIKRITG